MSDEVSLRMELLKQERHWDQRMPPGVYKFKDNKNMIYFDDSSIKRIQGNKSIHFKNDLQGYPLAFFDSPINEDTFKRITELRKEHEAMLINNPEHVKIIEIQSKMIEEFGKIGKLVEDKKTKGEPDDKDIADEYLNKLSGPTINKELESHIAHIKKIVSEIGPSSKPVEPVAPAAPAEPLPIVQKKKSWLRRWFRVPSCFGSKKLRGN